MHVNTDFLIKFCFPTKVGGGIRYPIFFTSKLSSQIVFARFNLKVVFPPPYEREVWHYKKANVDHIRKAINGCQSEK